MGKHWTSTTSGGGSTTDSIEFYMAIKKTLFVSIAAQTTCLSLNSRTMNRIYKAELYVIPALWESGMRGAGGCLPCPASLEPTRGRKR